MIKVKVPATSANMGPGFDSLGVALALYNTIGVTETDGGLTIVTRGSKSFVSSNENNLIYRSMKVVFDKVGYAPKGIKIVQNSSIPMTRGLGSSSACIIAGMLGANVLAGRPLDYGTILDLAAELEGHPDNVTPALYGGFCTAVREGKHIYHTTNKLTGGLKFAALIPEYYVATRKSRTVVPESFSKPDCVYNVSRAAMLTAALINERYDLLRTACEDRMHQPYREEYIEGMGKIFEKSYELGSLATYLSGSGPTIVSLINTDGRSFMSGMNEYFDRIENGWRCRILDIDNVGAVVSYPAEQ